MDGCLHIPRGSSFPPQRAISVNLIHSQTHHLKSAIDDFSSSDLHSRAGNQTELANENHHQLHISPHAQFLLKHKHCPSTCHTQSLDTATLKTSRDAARNKQKLLKDVFLFSYRIPGIMARGRGFHRIHSLAACNLRGQ